MCTSDIGICTLEIGNCTLDIGMNTMNIVKSTSDIGICSLEIGTPIDLIKIYRYIKELYKTYCIHSVFYFSRFLFSLNEYLFLK
jgi:hypothetical protein